MTVRVYHANSKYLTKYRVFSHYLEKLGVIVGSECVCVNLMFKVVLCFK